ncbi:MAG: DUF3362 domain-containing protein, partial [Clostridia bacterium]|nr:DUF3362 domain-containing protein [Clostridia bacterium]
QNYDLVVEALEKCGRTDLIGYGEHCLIRPRRAPQPQNRNGKQPQAAKGRGKPFDKKKPLQKGKKPQRNTKKGR